jgi:hypothetical protein
MNLRTGLPVRRRGWAAVPEVRWPEAPEARAYLRQHWEEPWGDRRQEIVFIGSGMDRAAITAALDACLIEADRMTPAAWARLPDPFPVWQRREAA